VRHRRGVKICGRIFVLSNLLLLAFSARALGRANPAEAGISPPASIAAPNSSADAPQTTARSEYPGARSENEFAGEPSAAPRLLAVNLPLRAPRFALAGDASAPSNTVILGSADFPATDAGFGAALAADASGGTVLLPAGTVITLTSAHVIASGGIAIDCAADAGFVSGVNEVNLITISGSGDRILGCHFWAGADPMSNPLFLYDSTDARIERDSASGFQGLTASFVYLVGARSSTISDNYCFSGSEGASCIFGEKGAVDTLVQSNNLDETLGAGGSHAITFHSTDSGETVDRTKILSNQIVAGPAFCVEMGAFGGDPPQGVVISANTCLMSTNGLGGYSVGSDANFWTVSNNTFDSNGFQPSISCIEVAGAADGTVAGNSCNGGNISLSNFQAQRVTISSNLIYGLRGVYAGIYLGTSVASGKVDDNLVIANLIHLPTGMAAVGIWQQCNAAEATCNNNSYSYNTIVSDGSQGSIGIKLENDTGASQNESVGPNTLRTPSLSIDPQGNVTYTNTQTGAVYTPPSASAGPAVPRSPVRPVPHIPVDVQMQNSRKP
jgi:hypothetical protein